MVPWLRQPKAQSPRRFDSDQCKEGRTWVAAGAMTNQNYLRSLFKVIRLPLPYHPDADRGGGLRILGRMYRA